MAHDVFISYSMADKPVADAICHGLEALQIRCWIAPRDQLAGKTYGQQITEAIRAARVMLLIFSAHTNQSQDVPKEINIADKAHIPIVTLRLADIEFNAELEYYIGHRHWVNAFPRSIKNYINVLADEIRRNLPAPAPWQPPSSGPRFNRKAWLGAGCVVVAVAGFLILKPDPDPDPPLLPTPNPPIYPDIIPKPAPWAASASSKISVLRDRAARGDAAAQSELGFMYMQGRDDLPQDDVEAVKWLRKAAEQGNAAAQNNLGFMYGLGRGGLPQDDVQAAKWYGEAAAQGAAVAQKNLGVMYEQGRGGLPKNDAMAVNWYLRAANFGNAEAQYALGLKYEYGNPAGYIPRDPEQAITWY
ncbi:MAG: toll/interleukin-1 receptor domain-containing protein, partial [Azonexus sp.]|nr:toll/interleukin-1 receptor domain-containing protein [Azonexus sp.]